MQEQQRTIRTYSLETERPYFNIRYRLSLTGRELLADALDSSPPDSVRAGRTDSMATTVTSIIEPRTLDWMHDEEEEKATGGRVVRSRSVEAPGQQTVEMKDFSTNLPGTPRTQNRKQLDFQGDMYSLDAIDTEMVDACDDERVGSLRRTRSAGTANDLQLHRAAPAIPEEDLYAADSHLRGLKDVYPQLSGEFRGLVACLNSKNVQKYRIGQPYRKSVIIGIDEQQNKIIVYTKNAPAGTLMVMKTDNIKRYEKGYTVQDVQGRVIGHVHAMDAKQGLLVVNTNMSETAINYY